MLQFAEITEYAKINECNPTQLSPRKEKKTQVVLKNNKDVIQHLGVGCLS